MLPFDYSIGASLIKIAAQINAFAMLLALSKSGLFVPQIIKICFMCCWIIGSSIL